MEVHVPGAVGSPKALTHWRAGVGPPVRRQLCHADATPPNHSVEQKQRGLGFRITSRQPPKTVGSLNRRSTQICDQSTSKQDVWILRNWCWLVIRFGGLPIYHLQEPTVGNPPSARIKLQALVRFPALQMHQTQMVPTLQSWETIITQPETLPLRGNEVLGYSPFI